MKDGGKKKQMKGLCKIKADFTDTQQPMQYIIFDWEKKV